MTCDPPPQSACAQTVLTRQEEERMCDPPPPPQSACAQTVLTRQEEERMCDL